MGSDTRVLPVIVPDIFKIKSIYISIYQVKCESSHHFLQKIAKNGEAARVGKKIKLRVESVNPFN